MKQSLYGMPVPPPPPSQEMLHLFYEEKREKITNISNAIPYIPWSTKTLDIPPPPQSDML